MLHTIDKTIKNKDFQITKIEASKALKMFNKVTKIINKGISKMNKHLDMELDAAKNPQGLLVLISDVLSAIDEDDLDTLDSWIKQYVTVRLDSEYTQQIKGAQEGDFAPLSNPLVFEQCFRGSIDLHLLVIFEFLSANFLDSINSLSNLKS